jgi:hypothetical protein
MIKTNWNRIECNVTVILNAEIRVVHTVTIIAIYALLSLPIDISDLLVN